MKKHLGGLMTAILGMIIFSSLAMFTVNQWQHVIVRQLGEIVAVKQQPGLYFKVPLLQDVRFFDIRLRTLDTAESERFITSEKKNVLVDYFVKWRIVDAKQYFVSVAGDEAQAQTRLVQTVNDSLRAEFGKRTVHDVVSGERDRIMEILRQKADIDARKIGVQVMDVRLKRVELPQEVSESVYQRMEAERKRVANELRSQGAAEAEKIRADADRQREVTIAEAYRTAQQTKGEGDAKASATYAAAYGQSPEFYAFYRSMEAYRQSFKNKSDVMVLEPNSEFFKYMKFSGGKAAK